MFYYFKMRVSFKSVLILVSLSTMAFMSHYFSGKLHTYSTIYSGNQTWWFENMFNFSNNQNQDSSCEVIHVGLVCTGYESSLYFYTMLKSLYFYRNNPLHFHILADKNSENNLKTLFESWNVPQVTVNFYEANLKSTDFWKIPETLKLTFPKLIPSYITEKLIVLDKNLTFADDVYELWNLFDYFEEIQAIGLIENLSNDSVSKVGYLKEANTHPNKGKSFQTAVILYHLKHLKQIEWNNTWKEFEKTTTSSLGKTTTDALDILNAIASKYPNLIYQLPCCWNPQLIHDTERNNCCNNNQIKILQWGSKLISQNFTEGQDYFRELQITFLKYNGSLLRRNSLYGCAPFFADTITELINGSCADFQEAFRYQWRILLFLKEFQYNFPENDVTLVSQLTFERLYVLEDLAKRWSGPISITFYVSDTELAYCVNFLDNSEALQKRTNIAYHVIFKENRLHHPINLCRNIALRNVVTPYVFLVDIDFLPGVDLYLNLKNWIGSIGNMEKKALVVPAFEVNGNFTKTFPNYKDEVIEMINNKDLYQFAKYRIYNAHSPTNYSKWKTAETPYKVKWGPRYEPYIVVRRDVAEYEQRFVGYGWNKVAHIMKLEAQGYEFIVLPDTFVIHKPHLPSSERIPFKNSKIYAKCLKDLMQNVTKEINHKYGRNLEIGNAVMSKV